MPPSTPPSGNFFCTPGEYVSMSNGVFNFNFLALLLTQILGGPKFTLQFTFTFTLSNCVSNFNILALVVSEIIGGSQIYVRGPCAPLYAPQRKYFCTRGEYFTMSNGVFNFNFLALLLTEILGGVPNLH